MGKRSKVYMPRWYRWFILPMLLFVWIVITYAAFFSPSREEDGLLAWIIATPILVGVGIVMWLTSSGKLPVYIVEEDDS